MLSKEDRSANSLAVNGYPQRYHLIAKAFVSLVVVLGSYNTCCLGLYYSTCICLSLNIYHDKKDYL